MKKIRNISLTPEVGDYIRDGSWQSNIFYKVKGLAPCGNRRCQTVGCSKRVLYFEQYESHLYCVDLYWRYIDANNPEHIKMG